MGKPEPPEAVFRLRPAVREDAPVIRQLVRSVGINPLGLDWPRFWVAVDDIDRIIGCAQVKGHRDGTRELASVAVRPSWRRRGVAGALIGRVMEQHHPPLWLTCRSSLVGLYRRFGFAEVADEDLMPPVFRRVRRLVNGVFRLLPQGEYLAVMVWAAAGEDPLGLSRRS